ncbi:hypothetical protein [Zoogloea sp.]|uniref:hypothetical protein n=1 Tax=Zoogloea sp. TaxID=49181 RepID=UPI001D7FD9B3|nr:hypothetical protein [Zoogloea sp.]MBK6652490.1 hypothetical protein [Zoogloea sp.]
MHLQNQGQLAANNFRSPRARRPARTRFNRTGGFPVGPCRLGNRGLSQFLDRANAEGEASTLIQAHGLYSALGQDAERRQAAYRALFRHELEPGPVDQIRRATNGNFVLGDERFAREIVKNNRGQNNRGQTTVDAIQQQ